MEENIQQEMVPWQRRKELGLLKALWATIRLVLFKPGTFFAMLKTDGSWVEAFLFYCIISLPTSLIGLVYGHFLSPKDQLSNVPFWLTCMVIVVLVPISIFFAACFTHLGVLIVRGKGGLKATFLVTAYVSAASLGTLIPFVGGLISALWGLVVAVIGLKRLHQFGIPRAILAYLFVPLVVALLAMLSAIAVPNLLRARLSANETAAQAALKTIAQASESYAASHNGSYPKDEYELRFSDPPYLSQTYNNKIIQGYEYSVRFEPENYEIIATPERCEVTGMRVFVMEPKGKLSERSCK